MFSKKILAALAIFIALTAPAIAQAGTQPDSQGWGGPGWYVSGGSPSASRPFEPAWVLFNGPHAQESACLDIHNRLYSPIGRCRLLQAKPASFGG
jgi:hypothetical protein